MGIVALEGSKTALLSELCFIFQWLEDGYLSRDQARWARAAASAAVAAVADDAVALVDAWEFSDHQLQSTLGRRDGQVYSAVLASAKASTLNSHLEPEELELDANLAKCNRAMARAYHTVKNQRERIIALSNENSFD